MPVLLEDSFVRLTYYPEHRLFENIVLSVPVGDDFRLGCDAVLALAQELQPRLWLTDNRLMGELSAEDLAWMAESLLPRFAELPVTQCAVVQSAEVLSHLALAGMLDQATSHITWQERMFASYEEAWSWLMKVSLMNQPTWRLSAEPVS